MSKKDLRFAVGEREFFIPAFNVSANYEEAATMVDEMIEMGIKPKKGIWLPGSFASREMNILVELKDLGVLSPDFFKRPVLSGSFWYQWDKNIDGWKTNLKQRFLAWVLNPVTGNIMGEWVRSDQQQRIFFTNWTSNR